MHTLHEINKETGHGVILTFAQTFLNVIFSANWILMLNYNWHQSHRIVAGFSDVRRKTNKREGKECTEKNPYFYTCMTQQKKHDSY